MNDHLSSMSDYSSSQQIDPNKVSRQLERILKSRAFRNAPLLQRFLAYITQKALEGRAEDIKEYSIATEVLNRSSDFDPKISPLVRVEARRLRERLTQYYSSEGAGDSIVFNIPRGGYVPAFESQRGLVSNVAEDLESDLPLKGRAIQSDAMGKRARVGQPVRGQPFSLRQLGNRWLALSLLSMLGITAFILFIVRPSVTSRPSATTRQPQPNEDLKPDTLVLRLWSNLLGNGRTAYVFYWDRDLPNGPASKTGRDPEGGEANKSSPRLPQGSAAKSVNPPLLSEGLLSFDKALVGAGEVQGVYALTRLLVRLGIPIEVHGCQALPKDFVSQRTVILLGPDLEKELRAFRPTLENYIFDDSGPAKGPQRTRILNLNPLAGEQQFFETQPDPLSTDIIHDWAILSVLPGIKEQRKTVVMAGLTRTGTQAVAEFCASGTGAVILLSHLGVGENEKTLPTFYQVLLRVTIKQGSIIDIAYVTGRLIDAAG